MRQDGDKAVCQATAALRRVISPSPLAGEGRERGRTSQLDPSDKAIGRAQAPSPQPSPAGFFSRLGWNDGHSESWAFTEIDRTLSAGLVLGGAAGAGQTTGSAWLGSSMEYPVRIAITWPPGAWASSSATAG